MPKMYKLSRHLSDVYGVSDADVKIQYLDLSDNAVKVRKNVPTRPVFAPVSTDELTNMFTCRLAMRIGIITSALQSRIAALPKE